MKDWIIRHKVISSVLGVILLLIVIGAISDGSKKTPTTQSNTNASTASQVSKQEKQPKVAPPSVPKYDLVGEYGQGGKVYVIAPNDATEAKLTLIAKDLNKRFGSDSFARISIFTDRSQAQILANNPLDAANLEGAAADAYDKAYVAQFNVNKSSGLKQFTIRLNGNQKDIAI